MIAIMIIITAVQEFVEGSWMCVVAEINTKHLVMTGKEHRVPRAVFAAFKHVSITLFFFFFFFRKKENIN